MALINAIAELERCGQTVLPSSEDEVKLKCPFHEDEAPSCSLNIRSLLFKCHAATCGASGDIVTLLARVLNAPRAIIVADLSKRYDLEQIKYIEPDLVERYHEAIWESKHLLKELYLRGLNDSDVRKYRLGVSDGRVTIPVTNASGNYVNVRRYLPGAPGAEKMRNTRNRSKIRLYPVEQLKFDSVVLCGGEIKAILAARLLNPHGFGAVCATAGEGNWHPDLTRDFADKAVYVMMDIDEGGEKASRKLCPVLAQVAKEVHEVKLPLDPDKYPTGDVNDFVAGEGGDLWPVVRDAPLWVSPIEVIDPDEEPTDTKFTDTIKSQNVGRRMRFKATVAAATESPFVVPKRIRVLCEKSQACCALCAAYPKDDPTFTVSPESPAILEMVAVRKEQLDSAIRGAIGVPRACREVAFDVSSHYDVEDVRVNPSIEITNRDSERSMQQAMCVSCEAELNRSYAMVGRLYPHPKTQQSTLLVSRSEATQDALSQYVPRDLHELRVFRPLEWSVEGVTAKLDDIYADLETNVTRIFMRRDLHLFTDFAYHSPLFFQLEGKTVKGWTEVLIAGDNGQGKSEVVENLMRHYCLGERAVCKNATIPGLLGGVQQLGNEWYVSWGALPSNDKRLVHLEEFKGISTEVIAKLTDARSSGVAEIVKVKRRRAHSRTRIVATSNARHDRLVSSFNFGIDLVLPLVGAPEDVRRFDAVLIVSSEDIDAASLAKIVRRPPAVEHAYTSDLCCRLILWGWTRDTENVTFDEDAADALGTHAVALAEKYTDTVPLIDRSTTRYKLARLAAAVACRTFSCGDDETVLRVRRCHVDYVAQTLDRAYSARTCGYAAYSSATRVTAKLIDAEAIKLYIENLAYPEDVRSQLMYTDAIDIIDIQDWLGTADRVEAQSFLSLLVRKRALRRDGRAYKKTPEFIQWLKAVQLSPARPDHVERKENF